MSVNDFSEMARGRRDLTRGARQILSGFGVRIIARILLILFVAKLFGASVFGRLGETVAIIELAAAFASFGLTKTLLGELARDELNGQAATPRIVEAIILSGIVSFVIGGVLWTLWPTIFPTDAAPRAAVIGVPLIALTDVVLTATRHHRTVAWDTIVKAVIKPWSFLALALLAYVLVSSSAPTLINISTPHALIGAYLGSLLLSAIVAFGVTVRMFDRSLERPPSASEIIGLGRRSFPIAVNETGVFAFRRVDIILLGMVAGPVPVGVYYLAQQIGTVVEKVRYLFEPMLAPIVAQSLSLDVIGAHLKRLCIFIFAVQLGLLLFSLLYGGAMMEWFGAGFAAGSAVLILILLGELFDGSFGLSELPLVYRHPKWPARAVLAALAIECVLVLILAQAYGAVGAAAGFAAAMLVLAVIRLALVWQKYRFQVLSRAYIWVALAGLAGAAPALALSKFGPEGWIIDMLASLAFIAAYGSASFYLLRQRTPPLAP